MVNIIGAGLAGLSAAIHIAYRGEHCRLISVQSSERAQSVLAEGGINAALDTMGDGDSVEEHYEDTIRGGCNLADEDAVRGLVENAPDIVKWLAELGVPFHREDGHIVLRYFGGQKKRRTAYAKSSTGKMIVSALIDEARKYEEAGLIERLSHHEFVRLILSDTNIEENNTKKISESDAELKAIGVRIKDTKTGYLYDSYGETILACGGLSGFFPGMTTGSVANTGDVAAIVHAQGVKMANLEMIQYHPTTIGISGKRCLISEAARGEGGRLFAYRDGEPIYFMEEKYPELGNLMPRDVVSREIYFVKNDTRYSDEVYLDMRGIDEEVWDRKLSDMREEIIHYLHIDPKTDPVPVEPGIHYFMGGIQVDVKHRTSISGVYAAGECACQYHGANRLGGNSLLGAIYGGKVAAEDILQENVDNEEIVQNMNKDNKEEYNKKVSEEINKKLGDILIKGMSIVRAEKQIQSAKDEIDNLKKEDNLNAREKARLELALDMLEAAYNRKTSLGAHYVMG